MDSGVIAGNPNSNSNRNRNRNPPEGPVTEVDHTVVERMHVLPTHPVHVHFGADTLLIRGACACKCIYIYIQMHIIYVMYKNANTHTHTHTH